MAHVGRFCELAKLIEKRTHSFSQLVVVVSAMGSMTDELMAMASKVHSAPPKREQDMLISVGERISMSLLAMALDERGLGAISFTGSQAGILTTSDHADAEIVEIRPNRIQQALRSGKIAIVAGFQGMSLEREITTLGRGGSDTSAVALAASLGAAHVEFYKDVAGIGRNDPKMDPTAEIFPFLSYDQALEIVGNGARVLHARCLSCAKSFGISLEIRSFDQPEKVGTYVSAVCPEHLGKDQGTLSPNCV